MVSADHKLSQRRQCALLRLTRSSLCYQPVGETAENLKFMAIIRCPAGELQSNSAEGMNKSWKHLGMYRGNLSEHLLRKYPAGQ